MKNNYMSEYYKKYLKGKRTTILISNDVRDDLNSIKEKLKFKSIDDLLLYLVDKNKKENKI